MKRWWMGAVLLLFLLIGSIYFFIPRKISIAKTVFCHCTENSLIRLVENPSRWAVWWPATGAPDNDDRFVYGNIYYRLEGKSYNSFAISMESVHFKIPSRLIILGLRPDSLAIEWSLSLPETNNPLERIKRYREARYIQQNMSDILESMKEFIGKPENIYGLTIHKVSTTDTLLISAKSILDHEPGNGDVYASVNALQRFAKTQGAIQTGPLLTNIQSTGSGKYQLMVAIPLNREISGNGSVESKRMVPGNFLMAETKGGESSVNRAMDQIKLYMHDNRQNDVALPFQVWVTDRMLEKDSSKWVTRLYFPVY